MLASHPKREWSIMIKIIMGKGCPALDRLKNLL
jgi:hypothetical protein